MNFNLELSIKSSDNKNCPNIIAVRIHSYFKHQKFKFD